MSVFLCRYLSILSSFFCLLGLLLYCVAVQASSMAAPGEDAADAGRAALANSEYLAQSSSPRVALVFAAVVYQEDIDTWQLLEQKPDLFLRASCFSDVPTLIVMEGAISRYACELSSGVCCKVMKSSGTVVRELVPGDDDAFRCCSCNVVQGQDQQEYCVAPSRRDPRTECGHSICRRCVEVYGWYFVCDCDWNHYDLNAVDPWQFL